MTGVGYNGEGSIRSEGQYVSDHTHPSIAKVVEIGVVCNNAHIVDGNLRGQPTEGAILACAMKVGAETTLSLLLIILYAGNLCSVRSKKNNLLLQNRSMVSTF